MTLGVSAIPVLSGAWAVKDKKKMKGAITSVLKTANSIAIPAGIAMAILAEPVLRILYVGTNAEASITISAPFVAIYGYAAILLSISTPITNMLQAIGRADVPVKALLIGATAKIICNYTLVGIPAINIKGAPIGTLVCYAYIVCHNLVVLLKETRVRLNWVDILIKPLGSGIVTGLATWGTYALFMHILPEGNIHSRNANFTWAALIAMVIFLVVWFATLLAFRVLNKNNIKNLPGGEKMSRKLEKRGLIH